MRKFLLFALALGTTNLYACDDNANNIKKYIQHISIEATPITGKQCRNISILFKAKYTYPNYVESVYISLTQNNAVIGEIPADFHEIIDGVNHIQFCLNQQLIKESKVSFILKPNETVKITPKGEIDHILGSLCYAEIVVDIKELVAKATIIDNS